MPVTTSETETKYEMPTGAALPRLDELPQVNGTSGPDEQQLEAEYYDTDDLRLLRAGVTLRRRRGGSDAGWHLKLPEGPGTRREIRLSLGQRRQVPRELAQLVRVYTRGTPLRPVARLTTRRQTLAAELKWLGGVLGEARDAEVLEGHLQAILRTVPVEQLIGPVQARVQVHFAPVRVGARTAVLAALDSERYFSLLDDLDQLIGEPPLGPKGGKRAGSVLPREVRRPYRKAGQWMARARRAEPGPPRDVALHQARKAAKRARYAGEAVTPALGRKAARFTEQVKRVQSVLGGHQDAVIARRAERELGIEAHLAGENAFTYGLLYDREDHAAERLRTQARKTWKQASRPRYRNWLG